MAFLSSLSFLYPWVLAALIALPLIWWLLRLVPPKPKTVVFPAIQFLFQLKKDEQSSATTPWWLLLLRLLIAALIILAIARPFLNLPEQDGKEGPLVLIVDDGWTAARNWQEKAETLNKLVSDATRQDRQVFIVTTSAPPNGVKPSLTALSTTEAMGLSFSMQPKSWPSDYERLAELLPDFAVLEDPSFHWLAAGIEKDTSQLALERFIEAIGDYGPVTIYQQETVIAAPIIGKPKIAGETMEVPLILPADVPAMNGILSAKSTEGQILASEPFSFNSGEQDQLVTLKVPNKVRNEISRLEINDTAEAGSVFLLDYRWQRRQIGLVSADVFQDDQPLLDENHYLTQALVPFFDIQSGSLEDLVENDVSLLALGDTGNLPASQERALAAWIEKGGVLIRFAGPKLANSTTALVPVELRSGNRSLQGAMSWSEPVSLGPTPSESPFAILDIPQDIKVRKQVLANPSSDLQNKTWAQLEDGTPLVTANQMGSGWLVLFHTTATPDWSNLPISGLFVEMLREIGNLGQYGNEAITQKRSLPPFALMTGFGQLTYDTGSAEVLDTSEIQDISLSAGHPPGYYGNDDFSIALNIGQSGDTYSAVNTDNFSAIVQDYEGAAVVDLVAPLLILAILLVLADQVVSLYLQGKLPRWHRQTSSAALLLLIAGTLFSYPSNGLAQDRTMTDEEKLLAATLDTRLGYVLTHDPEIDAMSHAGLLGLSQKVRYRTSVEAKEPLPIDIEQDHLLFYPMIYWPVTADFAPLSEAAIIKLNDYFKGGGTVLFDTRNQNTIGGFGVDPFDSPENTRLRQMLSRLDIPRLVPVPVDHVMTRSFYLMQSFPGRYSGGDVWIEDTAENQGNDGVASILIGSNDWAAAWAIGQDGKPLAAVIPGNDRQREMAFRFGINLVMYTLTGNYKADQVHIPAILERLSQ